MINIFLELLDKICVKKIEHPITIPNSAARYSKPKKAEKIIINVNPEKLKIFVIDKIFILRVYLSNLVY